MSKFFSKHLLICMSVVSAAALSMSSPSYAADEECTFQSAEAHYATHASPGEPLVVKWRKSSSEVVEIQWVHGGVNWFAYAPQPGTVRGDGFPGDYHLRFNLGMTTSGYEASRYEVRGYINTNISLPNATLAGVFEGTGSAWFVAYGRLDCVPVQ